MKNPYKVLGLKNNASLSEIKSAFRSLAKRTHPDVNGGDQELTLRFKEVAEAYAILSDPKQKRYYDELTEYSNSESSSSDYANHFKYAKHTAQELENYIHSLYAQMEPYKQAASRATFIGLAWLIGGISITAFSYLAAVNSGGGSYIIAWGAILFGGIQAVKSFIYISKINDFLTKAETEIWKSFE